MANIIQNTVTINGDPKKVQEFIDKFVKEGFESYVPMPQIFKDNPYFDMSFFLKELFGLSSEEILNPNKNIRDAIKNFVLRNCKMILKNSMYAGNKYSEEQMKNLRIFLIKIIDILEQTGYFSKYEFSAENWGVTHNVWGEHIKVINNNIIQFDTKWSVPLKFFETVAEKTGLNFHIKAVEVGNLDEKTKQYVTKEYIINKYNIFHKKQNIVNRRHKNER